MKEPLGAGHYRARPMAPNQHSGDVRGRLALAAAVATCVIAGASAATSYGDIWDRLLRRRYAVASFGGLWLAFSFAGLLLVYWISELELEPDLFNTSYRTIATPVLGAALLVPQLVGRDSVPAGTDS